MLHDIHYKNSKYYFCDIAGTYCELILSMLKGCWQEGFTTLSVPLMEYVKYTCRYARETEEIGLIKRDCKQRETKGCDNLTEIFSKKKDSWLKCSNIVIPSSI